MGTCQSAVVVHDQAADVSRHLIDFTKELECSRHGSMNNSSRKLDSNSSRKLNSKSATRIGSSSRRNMNASKQFMAPTLSERTCRTSATQNSSVSANTLNSSTGRNDESSDHGIQSHQSIAKNPNASESAIAVPDEIGSSQRQRKRRNHKRRNKKNNDEDPEANDEQSLLEGSQNCLDSSDARQSMMRAKSFKSRVTSSRRNNCSLSSMDLSSLMDTSMPFLLEEDDF